MSFHMKEFMVLFSFFNKKIMETAENDFELLNFEEEFFILSSLTHQSSFSNYMPVNLILKSPVQYP